MTTSNQSKPKVKIVILEDNEFYNKLLRKQLEDYTQVLSAEKNVDFEIESFLHARDFLLNLKDDIDALLIDYYLGEDISCLKVIDETKAKCKNCRIAVISREVNFQTSMLPIAEGADMFIHKNAETLKKVSYFVEYAMSSKAS